MRWRDCSRLAAVQYAGIEPYHLYAEVIAASISQSSRPPIVFVHGGAHTGTSFRVTPDGRAGLGGACRAARLDLRGGGLARPRSRRSSFRFCADVNRASGGSVQRAARTSRPGRTPDAQHVGPDWLEARRMRCRSATRDRCRRARSARTSNHCGRGLPIRRSRPIRVTPHEARHFVSSPRFPMEAFDQYFESLVPESARVYNERLNVRGMQLRVEDPERLRSVPTLVVSADVDPNHPGTGWTNARRSSSGRSTWCSPSTALKTSATS